MRPAEDLERPAAVADPTRATPYTDYLQRLVMARIRDESLSVTTAARGLNISETAFVRRLKAEGTTFLRVRCEIRRMEAERALLNSNCTIRSVAFRVGYLEVRAFRRAFKTWTALSPGEFRRRKRLPKEFE